MSRVLLTGATGLIGRNTLAPLLAAGHEVHAVARAPAESVSGVRWHPVDLLDDDAAALLLDAVKPQELVHLAWYAEHGRFWTSPENLRWVGATLELLRRSAGGGGRGAVMAGPCAEYDWPPRAGGAPPRLREGSSPLRPATLYGTSKHATHLVAEAFASQAGVELAWGRVFFLYGPGEQPGRLVPALARGLLAGAPPAPSHRAPVRDLIHLPHV